MIYADNAATTRLDSDAFEKMKRFYTHEYGNPSQPYSFSRTTRIAVSEARESIANCIGAKPEEIYFTSGGTESDNWALKGYVKRNKRKDIITSSIEHHAVLHTVSALSREGYKAIYLDVTKDGIVSTTTLEDYITDNASVVSIMLANNEIGSIQPIRELAMIAHSKGAVFHTDAVQAIGHIPIDVKDLGIDMMSASAHKFNGPRGIGFLYVRDGIELYPLIDGGAQESRMRSGTENVPGIVGMSIALQKNCQRMLLEQKRLFMLENKLINGLRNNNLDFIRNGSDKRLPGIINLSFKNSDGEMLLHRMDLMGICISTGSACDSKNTQVSHVINAISVPEEYKEGTIRISLGHDNTEQDINTIVNALTKVLSQPNK